MGLQRLYKPRFPDSPPPRGGTHTRTHTPLPTFALIVPSLLGRSPAKTHPMPFSLHMSPLLTPSPFLQPLLIRVLSLSSNLASQRLIFLVQEWALVAQPPEGLNAKEQQDDFQSRADRAMELAHVTGEHRMHMYTQPCTVPADTLVAANPHLPGTEAAQSPCSKRPLPSPISQYLNTWGVPLQTSVTPLTP